MGIVAQAFGIVGMIWNILLYQQKKHSRAMLYQFFAALSFMLNYLLLGAVIGGLLNLFGALRSLVFYFEKKTNASHPLWLIVFILAFACTYPLSFLAFGTEATPQKLTIELLPVLAMIVATVSFRLGSSKAVRAFGLIASPLWLIYNFFSGSIGAVASEILNLISIITGIIRLDRKKRERNK
jgi:hypothetical protein